MRDSLKKKKRKKERKKTRRKSTLRWNYTSKVTPPVSKAGSLVCNRVSAVVQKLFPAICLRGWKTSPRRCILESASLPSPRNFFNIRIRVGPPTRAQSLPRRRRLSLFRVRERNFSFRGRAKQNPIGSIFHSRSQEDQSPDNFSTTFRRLINSFSLNDSRLNDSLRDSWTLRYPSISLSLSLSEKPFRFS